jgi:integrase
MKVERVIAPGIYRMENGSFRVVARVGDRKTGPRPKEKRFPKDTALKTMKAWQEDQRSALRREKLRPVKGTLADGVERYLALPEVKALVAYKDRVREISAWLKGFGHLQRHLITPEQVRAQLNQWRYDDNLAAQTCNLRRHAFGHLYTLLDGKNAYNPVRDVPKFKTPKPTAKWLPYETIEAVFGVMRRNETIARLMLMAYAGYRPSEIKRTQPSDVLPFLDLPEPFAIKRCGKGGNPVSMPLTPKAVDAWRLLIKALGILDATPDQWTAKMRFGTSSMNHNWKDAMRRAGDNAVAEAEKAGANADTLRAIALRFEPVHCYRLKHSFAVRLLIACDNKELVQKALGHTSEKTTSIYTMMAVDPRLTEAIKKAFGA